MIKFDRCEFLFDKLKKKIDKIRFECSQRLKITISKGMSDNKNKKINFI